MSLTSPCLAPVARQDQPGAVQVIGTIEWKTIGNFEIGKYSLANQIKSIVQRTTTKTGVSVKRAVQKSRHQIYYIRQQSTVVSESSHLFNVLRSEVDTFHDEFVHKCFVWIFLHKSARRLVDKIFARTIVFSYLFTHTNASVILSCHKNKESVVVHLIRLNY